MVNIFTFDETVDFRNQEGTGWGTKAERRLGGTWEKLYCLLIILLWIESSSLDSLWFSELIYSPLETCSCRNSFWNPWHRIMLLWTMFYVFYSFICMWYSQNAWIEVSPIQTLHKWVGHRRSCSPWGDWPWSTQTEDPLSTNVFLSFIITVEAEGASGSNLLPSQNSPHLNPGPSRGWESRSSPSLEVRECCLPM